MRPRFANEFCGSQAANSRANGAILVIHAIPIFSRDASGEIHPRSIEARPFKSRFTRSLGLCFHPQAGFRLFIGTKQVMQSTSNVSRQRIDSRESISPKTNHIWGPVQRSRQRLGDDNFATIRRSASEARLPIPLLLSAGKFPIRFGRYEILRLLGQGQMGSVFLARDTQISRQVAIKISRLAKEGETIDRFAREARVMANLRHPNICPVHDAGDLEGTRFFTMAYIKGQTLAEFLDRVPPLSDHHVAMLLRTVALALDTAHRAGVVHRDLKPANIIIKTSGEPVIMDFGLARDNEGGSIVTRSGVILGTPAYMPPEQVLGQCELIGPRSDIYALGILMYQILAGRIPFRGKLTSVLKQIISGEPPPPSQFNPNLDRQLESICLKAMVKTIDHRFASAVEMANALHNYLVDAKPYFSEREEEYDVS